MQVKLAHMRWPSLVDGHTSEWFVWSQPLKRFCTRYGEVQCDVNLSCVGRQKLGGLQPFSLILFLELKLLCIFGVKSWSEHIKRCLESTLTTHFNHPFLLTSTLKTGSCVMALFGSSLIKIQSQSNRNLILAGLTFRYPTDCRWVFDQEQVVRLQVTHIGSYIGHKLSREIPLFLIALLHCDTFYLTLNFLEHIVVLLDHLKSKLSRAQFLLHLKEQLLLFILRSH